MEERPMHAPLCGGGNNIVDEYFLEAEEDMGEEEKINAIHLLYDEVGRVHITQHEYQVSLGIFGQGERMEIPVENFLIIQTYCLLSKSSKAKLHKKYELHPWKMGGIQG